MVETSTYTHAPFTTPTTLLKTNHDKHRLTHVIFFTNNRRTRRTWLPNAHKKRVFSEVLNEMIPMRVTTHALRCMDKAGGLDEYILNTRDQDLKSVFALELKQRLKEAKKAMGDAREVVDFEASSSREE